MVKDTTMDVIIDEKTIRQYLKDNYELRLENKYDSYSVIGVDSLESPDIEVFYKGKKIQNVVEVKLAPVGMIFENDSSNEVLNWKEEMEKQ